jgi:hypothetical protein
MKANLQEPSPWPMRVFLIVILILFVFLSTRSCAPTVRIMPEGCKPAKKVKHEMVEPTYEKHKVAQIRDFDKRMKRR